MPRDYSKPPRDGDRSKRDGYKPGGFTRKPWEKRERPQGDDRGERGFSKPRSDDRGERPFRKPYGDKREFGPPKRDFGAARRDFRPPHRDDELFAAKDKVADIVGPDPQSRYDMLRKLWDFFREEKLIIPAGHRPPANADDWRHGERHHEGGDERPPKRVYRKPAGEHPTAQRARTLEGVPRRKFKETRER
jgi:hypothetical protein